MAWYDYDSNSTTLYTSGLPLTIGYSVTSALAGGGNLAIVLTFATHRKLLKKNFNVLILNLAIADLAVGFLDLPWIVSTFKIVIYNHP